MQTERIEDICIRGTAMDNIVFWDTTVQNYVSVPEKSKQQRSSVCVIRLHTEPSSTSLRRTKSTTAVWGPTIPQRVSSMNTRCRKNHRPSRPDLATFHRQSCQLFASLDETLSQTPPEGEPPKYRENPDESLRSSTSTTPGSGSPTFTKSSSSTSTLGKHQRQYTYSLFPSTSETWYNTSTKHLALDPKFNSQNMKKRSHSQLSPQITSTEPIFWTSKATREAEYAKIDAAHSGFKGLLKRIAPRSWAWCHGKRRNFYAVIEEKVHRYQKDLGESNSSDTDSVRRYRLSNDEFDVEKSWNKLMRQQHKEKAVTKTAQIFEPSTSDDSDDEPSSALELAAMKAATMNNLSKQTENDQSTRGRLRKKISGFFN